MEFGLMSGDYGTGDVGSFNLDEVRFDKRANLSWSQLDASGLLPGPSGTKVKVSNSSDWATLEEVFRGVADLKGQNESTYQSRCLAYDDDPVEKPWVKLDFLGVLGLWGPPLGAFASIWSC